MAASKPTTASQVSTKSPTIRRILREAAEISNSPSPDYTAEPLDSDLFEWHFTFRGPPNSVYSQGIYHGRIILPPTYPLRPPSFRFTTPNGRFEANREICLSISGHHEETWQPAWGIRTALVALRSFMETDAKGQLGGIDTTDAVRRRLAQDSGSFRCLTCARSNQDIIVDSERHAQSTKSSSEEVKVPQELSMGWRDELESGNKDKTVSDTAAGPGNDPESKAKDDRQNPTGTETVAGLAAAGGDGHVPTQSAPRLPQLSNQRPATPRNRSVVPLWVDRAIAALIVLLVALLLKVLMGA
ncbi:hypothetical protein L249_5489 [Ophiocordyceps polyrhachis-furcata BCC 54312]|uniref:UBC core domain-containing protein n=1 Tax=Ophiocordyceps polyrhachis-furcata BCC 54312 TaxID=1330021 RepID=A0A367LGD7_9HYPO|nr:hypothetical protein L249_5489 [Ophiocordyceps polyrhachis-furcata BCC 54312]